MKSHRILPIFHSESRKIGKIVTHEFYHFTQIMKCEIMFDSHKLSSQSITNVDSLEWKSNSWIWKVFKMSNSVGVTATLVISRFYQINLSNNRARSPSRTPMNQKSPSLLTFCFLKMKDWKLKLNFLTIQSLRWLKNWVEGGLLSILPLNKVTSKDTKSPEDSMNKRFR